MLDYTAKNTKDLDTQCPDTFQYLSNRCLKVMQPESEPSNLQSSCWSNHGGSLLTVLQQDDIAVARIIEGKEELWSPLVGTYMTLVICKGHNRFRSEANNF